MIDLLILFLRCQNHDSLKKSSECIPSCQEFLPVVSYFHNTNSRVQLVSALGQRESTVKRIWSLQTALKTQQIKCEVPVAQLGAGQVALAVSHFPSRFKAALLSAFHVSELLPFVQFLNCSFAASIHGF